MQDFVVVAVLKDHIEDDQMYEAILITGLIEGMFISQPSWMIWK